MALKKADVVDYRQKRCENEAIDFVYKYFKNNKVSISKNSIRTIWLAFIPRGYRCMMNSSEYENLFFEIIRNVKTGEYNIHCFERFEYVVHPSNEDAIVISYRPQRFIKTS